MYSVMAIPLRFSARENSRPKEQDIPLKYWNPLQKGQTIEADGIIYTPEMVLGPARKGIRLTYTTDTRPTESILRNAKESDLFICEGMYGEDDKADKARGYKHMTFREAAWAESRSKRNVADTLQSVSGQTG